MVLTTPSLSLSKLLRISLIASFFLIGLPRSVRSGEFTVFGPQTFVRGTGAPVKVTHNFTVQNPSTDFLLRIYNGGLQNSTTELVSSSIISLNGIQMLGPEKFNQTVNMIEIPVTLQPDNTLDVEVRAKPGGILAIHIIGTDNGNPDIQIMEPANGSVINETRPQIITTYSDAISGINPTSFYAEINGVDSTNLFTVTTSGATCQVTADLPSGGNVITASISDYAGNTASATSNFTIAGIKAIPGAHPTSGYAPLTVYFTTNGEDPTGTIEIFRWDFDGDGSWDTYDTVARDYTRTYHTPGPYDATLYVQSSTGETATASITITVENNPPIANADVIPSNGAVPLTVQLYGSGTDSDGHITLYEWDFEADGVYDWSSATAGNTTYTYTAEGVYHAVFRVTDNDGLTGMATAVTTVVRVGPEGSPTATASATPTSGDAPLTVSLSGTATDPDNSIVLYEWDFDNDGVYDWSSATGASTSHTYTQAGTRVATLRVTDETGLTGIDQLIIFVNLQTSLSVSSNTVGFLDSGVQMAANASSQYSGYPPSNAVDGNMGTYWIAALGDNVPGSWFEVAFNSPQRVSGLTVHWYSSSYKMQRGRIEIYDVSGGILYSQETDLIGVPSQINLPNVENAVRLRLITVTTNVTSYHVIREFEVDSTPMPDPGGEPEPTGTNINTSISASTAVSVYIKDADGNILRHLVNNESRDMGAYSDYWDCRDDAGFIVNDGLHYAILAYQLEGSWHELDLTHTTGGTRYSFPFGSGVNQRDSFPTTFSPFEDDFLPLTFRISPAQEVTAFIGPLWTGGDPARIRTIVNRKAYPTGEHTIYWDGLDDQGNTAQNPPGDSLITGFWRYSLPNNAIYMTGGMPEISDVSVEENYFSPFSEECDESGNCEGVTVSYTLSEDAQFVELRVYSVATSSLVRTHQVSNVQAGDRTIFWDGKNNNNEYVDIGDYRVGVIATDTDGNQSMLRYALVRIDY